MRSAIDANAMARTDVLRAVLIGMRESVMAGIALVALLSLLASPAASQSMPAAPNTGPLIVDDHSHVVIMEYENWFGPKAVTFQGAAAMPLLQSADMAVGGGYDSAYPVVIKTHLEWLEYLKVDAALIEVTNNVSCIFNSEEFAKKYLQNCTPDFRLANQIIRNNTGNTYPAWTKLGTRLKLIPLLGGIDQDILYKDIDGKAAFEKEIEYFAAFMSQYPDLNIIYQGKPLMLVFVGAAQDPNRADNPLWFQLRKFLRAHPEIEHKYTFRQMAGYLDSQPYLWKSPVTPAGPIEISPSYGFWSWVDRLKPTCTVQPYCPYYPSYNRAGARVENFTVSIATAGQNGWGCPNPNVPPYCPDASLRYGPDKSYATFDGFMEHAAQLSPFFCLFITSTNLFLQMRDLTQTPTTTSSLPIFGDTVQSTWLDVTLRSIVCGYRAAPQFSPSKCE